MSEKEREWLNNDNNDDAFVTELRENESKAKRRDCWNLEKANAKAKAKEKKKSER